MPLVLESGEEIDSSCVCGTESVLLLAWFFFSPDVYIFHSGAGSEFVFQNRQMMVISLGCCCR